MHLRSYPVWQEVMTAHGLFDFLGLPNTEPVRWCPVDVRSIQAGGVQLEEQRRQFPRYFSEPEPLEVQVNAGDVLYLPAMWYHFVQQDELGGEATIAVNCWVDMDFNGRYAYLQLVEKLCIQHGLMT
jgi:hypothetical protein